MSNTDRATYKTGLVTILETFSTAHPDYCRRVFRSRPTSSPDKPFAFIDSLRETNRFDSGTHNRVFSGLEFVLVFDAGENLEQAIVIDEAVDAFVDHLAGYPQMGGTRGVWSRMEVGDESYALGEYDFPAVRFSFPDISVLAGRD